MTLFLFITTISLIACGLILAMAFDGAEAPPFDGESPP
jgi:hypothetical protein